MSRNSFGCDIDEQKIEAQADAMASSGMSAAGYRYVVIDDCWYSPTRAGDGSLVADPTRFPNGIKALADRLHAQRLELGICSGASDLMCEQLAGSYPGQTGRPIVYSINPNNGIGTELPGAEHDWGGVATMTGSPTTSRRCPRAQRNC